MTRKKVELAYITNDSARKATFRKRSKGLIKKVNELSTLCGIKACAVIYSPYDSTPEVWPSNAGAQSVISDFRSLPEMDQQRKMVDQESFVRQRITKSSDQWKRQKKENREMEMIEVMFQSLRGNMRMFQMNIMDLNDLGYMVDQYIKELNRKIEIAGDSGMEIGESSNAVAPSFEGVGAMEVDAGTNAPIGTITQMGSSSSSAAAATFLNSFHQQNQFLHPMGPPAGPYQHHDLNLNHNQNQPPWFMEMMNHHEQLGSSFMVDNQQLHHQQQQIPNNSSTVSAAVSSGNAYPVTDPNHTNNIWFP